MCSVVKKIILSGKTKQAFRSVGKFRPAANSEVVARSVSSSYRVGDHVSVRDAAEKQSDLVDRWLQSEESYKSSYGSSDHVSWLVVWKELESWERQLRMTNGKTLERLSLRMKSLVGFRRQLRKHE